MDNNTLSTLALNATNSTWLIDNLTFISLDLYQCFLTDFPESRNFDCSQRKPNICVKCKMKGGYLLSKDSLLYDQSTGNIVCRIILALCFITGLIGTFANAITSIIIQRREANRAFDFLLLNLAYADLLCCMSSLSTCCAWVTFFEKMFGTGQLTFYWIYFSMILLQLSRSISFHLTVLITIERYMVVAYPLRSRTNYCPAKYRIQLLFTTIYVVMLLTPGITSIYIGKNIYSDSKYGLNIPSLAKFEYIFRPTSLRYFWIRTLGESFDFFTHLFTFCLPNLILLICNSLTVYKIRKNCRNRQFLNCTQRKEVQVTRMFIPVVVIVLICSVWTLITFGSGYFTNILYREVWMTLALLSQINSTANFFIYYFRSSEFQMETKSMLASWW